MSILSTDVKLFESQRLIDEDDGGGRATGNVIVDGDLNNLFPDISRLDRTIGDVALRKAFVGVATANADTYLGAHAILTVKPTDPNVSVVLFNTGSESDERSGAQDRIESYVVRGAAANWFLLGDQYAGQRLIIGFQELDRDRPEVGEVYELEDDGGDNQFVRLTDIESEQQTFIEELPSGNVRYLERRKLTMGISAPIETNFTGGQPRLVGTSLPASDVHTTEVADAARYYGVTKTTAEALVGDLSINVESIFAALVPSAQKEAIWLDEPGGYVRRLALPLTDSVIQTKGNVTLVDGWVIGYAERAITPGTLTVTFQSAWTCVYIDDGAGNLVWESGKNQYSAGTVDYASGQVSAYYGGSGGISTTLDYLPAANYIGQAETGVVAVTAGNRSFSWTLNLAESKPRPGTLVINYLAQGKWQIVEDNGTGQLAGQGSGTLNFVTGSVAITFPVMPDVGTPIVYAYIANVPEELTLHSGALADKPQVYLQLGSDAIKPGSVSIAWYASGNKTATDDGAGAITGDAIGSINYATGQCILEATGTFLNITTELTCDFDNVTGQLEAVSFSPDANGVVSGTLANFPILAGSLSFTSSTKRKRLFPRDNQYKDNDYTENQTVLRVIVDDGASGFKDLDGNVVSGSINYTTGAYTLTIEADYTYGTVTGTATGSLGYGTQTTYGEQTVRETITAATNIHYQLSADVHSTQQQIQDATTLVLRLLATSALVVPGSVIFEFSNDSYIDIDGVIMTNADIETGAGTAVGAIDYTTGQVTLSTWDNNENSVPELISCATMDASIAVSVVKFRTPGKPLRPGSLQITAIREDTGALITASADADGTITHAELSGSVEVDNGLVDLWFTSDDTDDTGASDIPIYPGSLRYNAVSYSYLPMDASLIGVDPVRLPGDGRVPIIRDGDVMVLAHTDETDIGTPVSDDVQTLTRDHQAEILVKDANAVELDPAMYVVDLIAGTVTFDAALVLQDAEANALTTPLAIFDRIEHMTVVSDTQISGELAMISQLAHDYPAGSTLSTALLWGDIAARVRDEFTQKSWNSSNPNWSDARIGDDTTASFNLIDYPVLVTNNGAITEKWALVFTSSSGYSIVGEQVGIIGSGTTGGVLEPINPNTGQPYFSVDSNGWGTGWVAGNVLRFDTQGCLAPMWLARTVLSGLGTVDDDSVTTQIRGDAD
jgi:hypothetical protein